MKLSRALVSEFLGTAFLLVSIVGSGALAHKLDMGNICLSVLCVAFSVAATLSALIFTFGKISAHFNPVVTLALALRSEFSWRNILPYWTVQILGAIVGVVVANLMFDVPAIIISDTARTGFGQWLAEFVASFGLLGIVFGTARFNPNAGPIAVPFYVAGAVFFTSSTCFANPAVTIARMFTNTLCGIAPDSVLAFIAAQVVGCFLAVAAFGWLFKNDEPSEDTTKAKSLQAAREHRELAGVSRR